MYSTLSSENKLGIDLYVDNYNGYELNPVVVENIKKDFIGIRSKINKFEVQSFLKDAMYFRIGLGDMKDLMIFGSSLYNPMLDINYLEATLINKYCENSIYSNTGISYLSFLELTKDKQNMIIDTIKNITLNKSEVLSDVVDDLNKMSGNENE